MYSFMSYWDDIDSEYAPIYKDFKVGRTEKYLIYTPSTGRIVIASVKRYQRRKVSSHMFPCYGVSDTEFMMRNRELFHDVLPSMPSRPKRRRRRLAAVLSSAVIQTLVARDLRRELDALVINAEGDSSRDNGESTAEVYVFSVTAPRSIADGEGSQLGSRNELAGAGEGSVRLRPHFQVVCRGELRALLLRAPSLPPNPSATKVHTQKDYIYCLVPDLQEITACAFYWGKMDRYEAERLLDNKPEGTFLLRDSAQEEQHFSVSFRKYGRSLHARIEHRFSFDSHDPVVFAAPTVTGLIEHYKDPECVMFFEPILTAPLPRAAPFGLQQLARAAIVSRVTYDGVEELPLPPRLRSYLKEYHYRQRVRVRRLEPELYDHPHHC